MKILLLAVTALTVVPAIAAQAAVAPVDSAAISGLGIRNIGSATMSGRVAAVVGRQEADGKTTLFVAPPRAVSGNRTTTA